MNTPLTTGDVTVTPEQAAKLEAFLDRIHTFTRRTRPDTNDVEWALALLLEQIGGLIEHHVKTGQPVGLLPYRVKTLLNAIEAEETSDD